MQGYSQEQKRAQQLAISIQETPLDRDPILSPDDVALIAKALRSYAAPEAGEKAALDEALYLLEVCYGTCDLIYDAYGAFPDIGQESDVTIKDKVGEFLHSHGRAEWDKPSPQHSSEPKEQP